MRLIDIEPFEAEKNVVSCEIYRHFISEIYGAVQMMSTASIPTIDAVPVVRCKDCKQWERLKKNLRRGYCGESECIMRDDDFCSYGERRESDG